MLFNFQTSAVPEPDYDAIRKYLLIEETDLFPADIILVFGNKHAIHESAERVVNLFKRGYAKKIIVSGGVLTDEGPSEARALFNAISKEINPENILVEDHATNTQENIEMSRELLAEKLPNFQVKSIIGIGSVVAGRRFLMSLKNFWPETFAMASNVNPFDVSVDKWETSDTFKENALAEYDKIEPYKKAGFLKEVSIRDINRHVAAQTPCPELALQAN